MVYLGVTEGISCTSYFPYSTSCASQDYLLPGYLTASLGAAFALVGLVSLLARPGEEPHWEPPVRFGDSRVDHRIDRQSRLAFVALVGAGLVALEVLPMTSLALETMGGRYPTFNPVFFTADLLLFLLADLIVLFVFYQWVGAR